MLRIPSIILVKEWERAHGKNSINVGQVAYDDLNMVVSEKFPFETYNIYTKITVKGFKDTYVANTLWDSGASFCVISQDIADFIGVKIVGEDFVSFGNSEKVKLKIGLLKIVFPNGKEQGVRVFVNPFAHDEFILGMNFIRSVKVCIEPTESGFMFSYEVKDE